MGSSSRAKARVPGCNPKSASTSGVVLKAAFTNVTYAPMKRAQCRRFGLFESKPGLGRGLCGVHVIAQFYERLKLPRHLRPRERAPREHDLRHAREVLVRSRDQLHREVGRLGFVAVWVVMGTISFLRGWDLRRSSDGGCAEAGRRWPSWPTLPVTEPPHRRRRTPRQTTCAPRQEQDGVERRPGICDGAEAAQPFARWALERAGAGKLLRDGHRNERKRCSL